MKQKVSPSKFLPLQSMLILRLCKHFRKSSISVGDHVNVLLFLWAEQVASSYVPDIFYLYLCFNLFTFFYIFNLLIVDKIRFEIRKSTRAHACLAGIMWLYGKNCLTFPGSSLACSGIPADKIIPLRREWNIFTYNTKTDIIRKN